MGSKINGNITCVLHRAENSSYSYQPLEDIATEITKNEKQRKNKETNEQINNKGQDIFK